MNIRYILSLLFCLVVFASSAQIRKAGFRLHQRDTVAAYVRSYTDSLKIYKARLDSLQQMNDSLKADKELDARYYRLFAPLTFYYNIAKKQFDLSSDTVLDEPDRTLLSVYMSRPDLVLESQKQLDKAGTIRTPISSAVAPEADIVEKVAPTVSESDVAPVDIIVKRPNFWKFSGRTELHLEYNHTTENWYNGSDKSYSSIWGAVTLWANYDNKSKFKWNNTLELKLSLRHVDEDTVHTFKTSEDRIKYTGSVGLQAFKKWYYTFQLIAETQMFRGFDANSDFVNIDFLSPLTVTPSIGMDYNFNWIKNKLNGSVHLAPFASTMKYCDRKNLSSRYGIEEGKHFNISYGSEININYTFNIVNGIVWRGRIYFYTSYDHCRLELENNFDFSVNKYLSGRFTVYPRFDDSTWRNEDHGYWQFKEYLTFGLTYSF